MKYVEWNDLKVGDKLVFRGYSDQSQTCWRYVEGSVYEVTSDGRGYVGAADEDGLMPSRNWGFNFERVEDNKVSEYVNGTDLKEGDSLVFCGEPEPEYGWGFVPGHMYIVGTDGDGDFGPIDSDGDALSHYHVGVGNLLFKRADGVFPAAEPVVVDKNIASDTFGVKVAVAQENLSLEDLLRELQEALTGTELSVTVDSSGFSMFDGLCNLQSPHNMDAKAVAKIIEAQSTFINMTKDWL